MLEGQIDALREEVEHLRPYKERVERHLGQKREWEARRRDLRQFVHYKNWYGKPRRLWPDVVCYECTHVRKDGCKTEAKFKCSEFGARCSKYGSCDWAELDKNKADQSGR